MRAEAKTVLMTDYVFGSGALDGPHLGAEIHVTACIWPVDLLLLPACVRMCTHTYANSYKSYLLAKHKR